MSGIPLALAAMLAIWKFCDVFQNPGRVCPACGGRLTHGRNCPYRSDDD